jgi:hypothetical protein
MANVYNEKFKKQLVKEYIQGKSYLQKKYKNFTRELQNWKKRIFS